MKDTVEKTTSDSHYQKNIEYGEPRSGHMEGKVMYHIAELEENLKGLASRGISAFQSATAIGRYFSCRLAIW